MKTLNRILLILLLITLVSAPVVWFVHREMLRWAIVASFEPHIGSYLTGVPPDDGVESPPDFLHGRMVVVNRDTRQIDPMFFELPDDVRATGPEDVSIVVVTTYKESKVGSYGHIPYVDGNAYACSASYQFVDSSHPGSVASYRITSTPPFDVPSYLSFFDRHAPHPTSQFLYYLGQLPHR